MDFYSELLINERPLQVLPSLAIALDSAGKAAMLQRIQDCIQESDNIYDGYRWIRGSVAEWQQQFPWIHSANTVQRYLKDFERRGILITANFNTNIADHTKWYRIDEVALNKLCDRTVNDGIEG